MTTIPDKGFGGARNTLTGIWDGEAKMTVVETPKYRTATLQSFMIFKITKSCNNCNKHYPKPKTSPYPFSIAFIIVHSSSGASSTTENETAFAIFFLKWASIAYCSSLVFAFHEIYQSYIFAKRSSENSCYLYAEKLYLKEAY